MAGASHIMGKTQPQSPHENAPCARFAPFEGGGLAGTLSDDI